jgi:4-carboxymuconolactone decarboxylase
MTEEQTRYQAGFKKLREVEGSAADQALDSLSAISPDFAKYCIEFPMGDIYSRTGLDIQSREIATIAALTALGNSPLQLKIHIQAAKQVGLSEEQIKEVIMQMSIFSGFPNAINAMLIAKSVFEQLQNE